VKYDFIRSQRTHYKVAVTCRGLEVSRSGYYDRFNRSESVRDKRHKELIIKIRQIHIESRKIYGSPCIHGEPVERGERIGKNTVAYLMWKADIQFKVHKRFVVTTDSRRTKKPADNLIKGSFTTDRANHKWAADVTFIATGKGRLYLSAIMDLYSRVIIGWSMGERNSTELVADALKMAVLNRGDLKGVILHSDQGVHASTSYQQHLAAFGIICGMSRKGNCRDNAPMKSFFHSLKTERIDFEDYKNRSEDRTSLFSYIELFYNRVRRHSALANRSPMAFENSGGVS